MTPTFSLLHASWGRPEKAVAAMKDALAKAAHPGAVEYIVAVNDDDAPTLAAFDAEAAFIVFGPFKGSAAAWDAAAKASRGRLLIQMQDDLVLPERWDETLVERVLQSEPLMPLYAILDNIPVVIAVSDGYRKDALLCTAICNRARYEQVGEFLHAGYLSVFSDDDFTVRAMRDAAEGRCKLIDARDIVFKHENPYHTGAPHDATLLRENSPEAYRIGAALFAQRNPWAAKYRTWA